MQAAMASICVPVPTHAQNSDRCGGARNTSPWMYFHPVSSASSAERACQQQGQGLGCGEVYFHPVSSASSAERACQQQGQGLGCGEVCFHPVSSASLRCARMPVIRFVAMKLVIST